MILSPFYFRDMDNVFWHSNVIVERIAHNQVKTLTGNTYMLEGPIDAVDMKKGGKRKGKPQGQPGIFIGFL